MRGQWFGLFRRHSNDVRLSKAQQKRLDTSQIGTDAIYANNKIHFGGPNFLNTELIIPIEAA